MNTFYLTTPIYYPNARPHVGSAYTTIVCDVLARYKRMCGYNVAFLTGTDEHGEKLQRAADAAGLPVERFVAEKRELFRDLWRKLGVPQFNPKRPSEYGYRFVHTSQNPDHVAAVHWMIRQASKAGYIDKKKYEGRYCISDERYVSDSPEPADCDICGRPAELISEENYFFKLSAFEKRLLDHYEQHPEFVQPDFRRNEVISFVRQSGGLRDISISRRRLKWGVPWPDDPEQVVYVWYDALTSYLTGIGFAGEKRSKDFEKYWMGAAGPTEVVHMIGKDILRFHAVYWPAFLMAANEALPKAEPLPLPKTIFAHGWIYYEQDKMSKSKGNVVYPEPIVDALESFGAPGNDALRYYLLRGGSPKFKRGDLSSRQEEPDTIGAVGFGHDTSFSYEDLIERYNADLANDLGNLASRTISMINRYCGGTAPNPNPTPVDPLHDDLRKTAERNVGTTHPKVKFARDFLEEYNFQRALDLQWDWISKLNRYLQLKAPWVLANSAASADQDELRTTLYTTAESIRFLVVLLYSALPSATSLLWKQLGCENYLGKLEDQRIDQLKWGQLKPGTNVGKPEPIFPRLDKAKTLAKLEELAEIDRERDKPKGASIFVLEEKPSPEPGTPNTEPKAPNPEPRTPAADNPQTSTAKITIDDFAKVEMVVGQIVAAEAISGAKKLLKLQVDIGSETRQVCAGIAEYYKPEELTGMKIVLVANLEPRKLRGVESNGMVVAASAGPEGRPVLATFKEDVPNGTRLK
jgi:methionyl-tRNA synthetase